MKTIITNYRLGLIIFILTSFLWVSSEVQAQETVAVGQVLNSADKSPVANVIIFFKNSDHVVQSNEEGYFMIRTSDKETTLVFSLLGFKQQEIKIKAGESVGMQVELVEKNAPLQEVIILPGYNPGSDWMKKVRLSKSENDLYKNKTFTTKKTEQNLVLLSKTKFKSTNKRLFEQLKKGSLSASDSNLVTPLYMAETSSRFCAGKNEELSKNIFTSPDMGEKMIASLIGEVGIEINFYQNVIVVFGKSIISPLSNVGSAYYDFYLADSTLAKTGKQYEIHFKTKNIKNLAFNGSLWIDSASLALTRIDAELPAKSNINFIQNLHIHQSFAPVWNKRWMRSSEQLGLNMTYNLLTDSLPTNAKILVKRSASYTTSDSTFVNDENFAKSEYNQVTLESKLSELGNTPLLRTAKWIADVALTGYFQVDKIDIGKILELARITDVEGLRLNLPFRTNQYLWKNISIGGAVGYGFKSRLINYSGMGQFKLPGAKKRVVGFNYTDDYRRIDYNYNDFMYRENPLVTGDEDISSTILSLWSANKLNRRKEYQLSFSNDWNSDIESTLYLRQQKLFANKMMPMQNAGTSFLYLGVKSVTINTRFSFNERTYEDHLQRIYILNNRPVVGITVEMGQFSLGAKRENYGKLMFSIKQLIRLGLGDLNYVAECGTILGNVPYPLLEIPTGTEAGGYGLYQLNIPAETGSGGYSMYSYNMMKYMEYGADKYLNLHAEFTMNGLITNQIPLIKRLNLRELFSFKMASGSLNSSHRNQLEYPDFMEKLNKPYVELGVGITNILRIFSIQSVWRLTDTHKAGVFPWGIRGGLSLSF